MFYVMLKYIRADLSFYLLQDTCWFSVVGVPFSCPAFTTLKTPVDGHRLGATNFFPRLMKLRFCGHSFQVEELGKV